MSRFSERSPQERGAEALAWYSDQWANGGVEATDASVLLVADVMAYSKREGEDPQDIATAAQASLAMYESEDD
jgi:hypothetical protein